MDPEVLQCSFHIFFPSEMATTGVTSASVKGSESEPHGKVTVDFCKCKHKDNIVFGLD